MKLSIATILSLAAGASAFTAPSLSTAVRSTTQVSETKVCFRTVFQYDLLKNSFDRSSVFVGGFTLKLSSCLTLISLIL